MNNQDQKTTLPYPSREFPSGEFTIALGKALAAPGVGLYRQGAKLMEIDGGDVKHLDHYYDLMLLVEKRVLITRRMRNGEHKLKSLPLGLAQHIMPRSRCAICAGWSMRAGSLASN